MKRYLAAGLGALLLIGSTAVATTAADTITTNGPVGYGDRLILGYALNDSAGCEASLTFRVLVAADESTVTDQFGGGLVFDATKRVSTGTARQRTAFTLHGGDEWSAGGGEATVQLLCRGAVIATTTLTVQP